MMSTGKRSLIHSLFVALMTVSIAASGIGRVHAQSGEDLTKGLLRALIDSRVEKSRRKHGGRDPFRTPQPRLANQQLLQLRTISANYAQETSVLSAVLNTDVRRDYHVRQHLPAALQFEATATAVRHQTASGRNHEGLVDTYRQLNSEWLTLSHQLRNQHGLSSQTSAVLDRIGQLDGQYCALLNIQQQFDNRQLVRAADFLSSELRRLSEELQYGVPASATRTQLIRKLWSLQQQAGDFANLVSDSQRLDVVVQEYQRLYQSWSALTPDLDRYSKRSITRSVQRVVATQQRIHSLLRLDYGLDRRLVQHLVRDVDATLLELFQKITLSDLMELPDSDEVASAADTAYGTLQHLADVVNRNEPRQEIGEAWVYVDEAWGLLAYYLGTARNPQVQHHLEEISGQLAALQQTVGVTVAWDYREMVQRSASLETFADSISQAVQRWHRAAGIQDNHRAQEAQELVGHCHELEQLIIGRRTPAQIREECDHIVEAWQHLRPYLQECQTAERETLGRLAAGFTPELIHIRTSLPE